MKQKIISHVRALMGKMLASGDPGERMILTREIHRLLKMFPELQERILE